MEDEEEGAGSGVDGDDECLRGLKMSTMMSPNIISNRRNMQARRPVFF